MLRRSDVASEMNARRRRLRRMVEVARRHEVRVLLVWCNIQIGWRASEAEEAQPE